MQHWVFTIGQRNMAPPVDWLARWDHHTHEMWFPRTKPPRAVSQGDRALVYGSQGRGFIAAVEVTGHEPEENNNVRYPWKLGYRLLAMKAADDNVASPAQAGINPNRVIRGPHSTIDPDEYERGVAVMLEAAQRSAA
jgi:hypothetical protein